MKTPDIELLERERGSLKKDILGLKITKSNLLKEIADIEKREEQARASIITVNNDREKSLDTREGLVSKRETAADGRERLVGQREAVIQDKEAAASKLSSEAQEVKLKNEQETKRPEQGNSALDLHRKHYRVEKEAFDLEKTQWEANLTQKNQTAEARLSEAQKVEAEASAKLTEAQRILDTAKTERLNNEKEASALSELRKTIDAKSEAQITTDTSQKQTADNLKGREDTVSSRETKSQEKEDLLNSREKNLLAFRESVIKKAEKVGVPIPPNV